MSALPRATARLQFHHGFTLDDAAEVVPYLHRLGISHLYASPLMKARPGSQHGYDVIDPHEVNPELGGEEALHRLVASLRRHDMGLILDIVPNHMGVGGAGNAWWEDVLEWGKASPYAHFFDIDWDPPASRLRGKLLAPFLGRAYGICLSEGEITLRFEPADGRLYATYYDHRFPIAPADYFLILAPGAGALAAAVRPLANLPTERARGEDARQLAAKAREALRNPALASPIAAALEAFQAATSEGRGRLHALLERQAYCLAWWQAAEEINWRRFFDITSLAGLRVERADVFEAAHAGIFRLYVAGLIDGVRVDHVDGLADPRGYCRRLRRRLAMLARQRPADAPAVRPLIWVEKILAEGEDLPETWQTDGTTGYDFMDQAAAVLHAGAGAPALTRIWTDTTHRPASFCTEAIAARRQILAQNLPAEFAATAHALHQIAAADLATRDFSLSAITRVLAALLAHFSRYRIYADREGLGAADATALDAALAAARGELRSSDHLLLGLIGKWLRGAELPASVPPREWLKAVVRFQQLSAPVAAKSVEDTAFYRYGRLLSRNDVGSDPGMLALAPSAFHARMRVRRRDFPHGLLATATHDHKRGEDTRARLAVVSELPELWAEALVDWRRRTAAWRKPSTPGLAPDAADEVILYQSLIGAWPLSLSADDGAGCAALAERLAVWQEKALRESKLRSGWGNPDIEYETACRDFLFRLLDPARSEGMTEAIAGLVSRIAPAGALNGLAQTTFRLTAPGVPDLYQGTEFWDFSLVDPDNRRPVDFVARETALAEGAAPSALLARWRDGRVKQALIARLLGVRARLSKLFLDGAYIPLRLVGSRARHALAFARVDRDAAVVVLATRLAADLPGVEHAPLAEATAWENTELLLPPALRERPAIDILGTDALPPTGARLPLGELLKGFPVSVLRLG